MPLTLKTFVIGSIENNCYLVFDQETKAAFLIDSPVDDGTLAQFISENNLNVKFIVLTHAHYDHIDGLNNWDVPFYLHPADLPILEDERFNGSFMFGVKLAISKKPLLLDENKPLKFESYFIEVYHTPGHTPGCVCLKLGDWLFSGDTLFCQSIGRTDLPFGSYRDIFDSIKNKLLKLPDKTEVYPGHGPQSTIGQERRGNPFLKL
jgi:glyoxylase-like metal-dependent hydrolase (beta-lactamase superfamily II)